MPADNYRYAAFVSYSRSSAAPLARDVQAAVERFGKSWRELRAVRVFRDDNSMSANASLWGALETALTSSAWFVLIADPQSAASEYVQREVSWWLGHRGATQEEAARRILLVLADGDLVWDRAAGRFDAQRSTAIPSILAHAYTDEPRWVDMRWYAGASSADPRFVDAVVDISAAVREQPKEELVGENVRQHRRTRRIARAAALTLVVLTLAALSSAGIAVVQRNHAVASARIADARYLSGLARETLSQDANAARHLAARAYLLDKNAASEASLLATVIDSGQVATLSTLPSAVTTVAASANGAHAVAGLEDGTVLLVDVASKEKRVIGSVDGRAVEVSVDDSGSLVAASTLDGDGRRAATLFDGEGDVLPVPGAGLPSFLRVAPVGGAVLVGGYDDLGVEHGIGVIEPASGTLTPVDDGEVLTRDGDVLGLDSSSWSVIDPSTGSVERTEGYGFGAKRTLVASPDGSVVAMAGGGGMVPLWDTGEGQGDGYVRGAACPVDTVVCDYWPWEGSFPDGFARGPMDGDFVLSADGSALAWAQGSTVWVSPVLTPDDALNLEARLVQVEGLGPVRALTFVGDRLVVATSAGLQLIDPEGSSPLVSRPRGTGIGTTCTTCGLRDVAFSPDGRWLAGGSWGSGLEVQSLVDDRRLRLDGQDLHPVVWLDDSTVAVVDLEAMAIQRVSVGSALTIAQTVGLPGLDNLSAQAMVMGGPLTENGAVRFITGSGEVWTLDSASLEVVDRRTAPEFDGYTIEGPGPAFSPSGRYAVGGGYLVDLDTGAASDLGLDPGALVTVSATGPVVMTDTAIEQYDTAMQLVSTVPVTGPRSEESIAVDPTGTWLVSVTDDDTMTVRRMADGALVGALPIDSANGGAARLDFDAAGSVHLLRTVGVDALATEQSLRLDPDAWLDAVCKAQDYRPLSATNWQSLAHMDPPEMDLC